MEDKIVKIEKECLNNQYPCKHICLVNNQNSVKTRYITGLEIANKYWEYIPEDLKSHFLVYIDPNYYST